MRAGVISLNSAQAPALASVLTSTIRREDTPRSVAERHRRRRLPWTLLQQTAWPQA